MIYPLSGIRKEAAAWARLMNRAANLGLNLHNATAAANKVYNIRLQNVVDKINFNRLKRARAAFKARPSTELGEKVTMLERGVGLFHPDVAPAALGVDATGATYTLDKLRKTLHPKFYKMVLRGQGGPQIDVKEIGRNWWGVPVAERTVKDWLVPRGVLSNKSPMLIPETLAKPRGLVK